jgi:hypothetical protein
MHNITFVNKANFVKHYNNFVLKWLIFALYVVVREHLENTLRICDVSAMGLYNNSILMFINFPKRSTCKCHGIRWSGSTCINIVSYINIPYQSETFGGEDFELCYIFSIFLVSSTFQPIACRAWNNIHFGRKMTDRYFRFLYRELKHIHTLIYIYIYIYRVYKNWAIALNFAKQLLLSSFWYIKRIMKKFIELKSCKSGGVSFSTNYKWLAHEI